MFPILSNIIQGEYTWQQYHRDTTLLLSHPVRITCITVLAIHYHFIYEPVAVTKGFQSLHPTQHDVVIYIPWWNSQTKDHAPHPIALFIVYAVMSKTYFEQICDIQSDIINCTSWFVCVSVFAYPAEWLLVASSHQPFCPISHSSLCFHIFNFLFIALGLLLLLPLNYTHASFVFCICPVSINTKSSGFIGIYTRGRDF